MADRSLSMQRDQVRQLLGFCESPVEQMLVVALWQRWRCSVDPIRRLLTGSLLGGPSGGGLFTIMIEPQKVLHTLQASYRADVFVHLLRQRRRGEDLRFGGFVIEVDGHPFHEKTKFQATRDRRRDRAMILDGFQVLRFTGSEVFTDPVRCAADVDALLRRTAYETVESKVMSSTLAELIAERETPPIVCSRSVTS